MQRKQNKFGTNQSIAEDYLKQGMFVYRSPSSLVDTNHMFKSTFWFILSKTAKNHCHYVCAVCLKCPLVVVFNSI